MIEIQFKFSPSSNTNGEWWSQLQPSNIKGFTVPGIAVPIFSYHSRKKNQYIFLNPKLSTHWNMTHTDIHWDFRIFSNSDKKYCANLNFFVLKTCLPQLSIHADMLRNFPSSSITYIWLYNLVPCHSFVLFCHITPMIASALPDLFQGLGMR